MPTVQEIYDTPSFWNLSAEARSLVLSDYSESFKKLKPEVQQRIVTFDPDGDHYDYETANKAGVKPDETGH